MLATGLLWGGKGKGEEKGGSILMCPNDRRRGEFNALCHRFGSHADARAEHAIPKEPREININSSKEYLKGN